MGNTWSNMSSGTFDTARKSKEGHFWLNPRHFFWIFTCLMSKMGPISIFILDKKYILKFLYPIQNEQEPTRALKSGHARLSCQYKICFTKQFWICITLPSSKFDLLLFRAFKFPQCSVSSSRVLMRPFSGLSDLFLMTNILMYHKGILLKIWYVALLSLQIP